MLRFYWSPLSPYSQRVHMFLEEAGLSYEKSELDLWSGETKNATFLAINPFGQVPAVEVNGMRLGESQAILRYLADRFELRSFYPLNLEDRARIDEVMEFATQHVGRYLMSLAWNLSIVERLGGKPNVAAIPDARAQLLKSLPRLDAHLAGRQFLSGPTVTIADCSLVPFLSFHRLADVRLDDYPNVRRYLETLQARSSYQEVLRAYRSAKRAEMATPPAR